MDISKNQYRSTGGLSRPTPNLTTFEDKVTRMAAVNHFETIHYENAHIETFFFAKISLCLLFDMNPDTFDK